MAVATLAIQIDCPPDTVARFARDPRNLPRWASAFCRSVSRVRNAWLAETPQGLVKIRFAPDNDFGVLDHVVTIAPGHEVHVPMRVVPCGAGSVVLFTLLPAATDTEDSRRSDLAAVERDLQTLKQVLEAGVD